MAITINGKVYRNLQEQVQRNMELYEEINTKVDQALDEIDGKVAQAVGDEAALRVAADNALGDEIDGCYKIPESLSTGGSIPVAVLSSGVPVQEDYTIDDTYLKLDPLNQKITLADPVQSKLERSLLIPDTLITPVEETLITSIVPNAITGAVQANLKIGDGLTVEDGALKTTGSGSGTALYSHLLWDGSHYLQIVSSAPGKYTGSDGNFPLVNPNLFVRVTGFYVYRDSGQTSPVPAVVNYQNSPQLGLIWFPYGSAQTITFNTSSYTDVVTPL